MNSDEIVTGEKLQEIADIYIASVNKLDSNPRIKYQTEKHLPLSLIDKPFNNPRIIFFYSDEIQKISKIIKYFRNPVILISHNSDQNILETYDTVTILESKNIIKWYSQNICFYHPKLFMLPIGLANSMWPHGNLSIFNNNSFLENIINHKINNI